MYLQTLYIVAISFTILFVLASLFLVNWKMIPTYWKLATIKVNSQKKVEEQIKEFEKKGMKPFPFEKGEIVVYAKNGNRALQDYRNMKKNRREAALKALKK